MIDSKLIEEIVMQVMSEMNTVEDKSEQEQKTVEIENDFIEITSKEARKTPQVNKPEDEESLQRMMLKTPARIGVGRAGGRLKTNTYLTLRADHAIARDAVFKGVSDEFINDLGIFAVQTKCADINEHLTRPDYGRMFDDEALSQIKQKCEKSPTVQIYVSDGLSSSAIEANAKEILPSIMQGLKNSNIKVGTPFFVKFGRVPAMDVISETLDSEVTCVLIGERPGLATANSMSAYICYRATVGMPEARRTVVSNIHSGGIGAVEAGAYIADIIKKILEKKTSGVDLVL